MTFLTKEVDNYLINGCGRCSLGGTPDCKVNSWTGELKLLRALVLKTGLTEELKWGQPCYTLNGKNVLIVAAFKQYSFISFFKGSLLNDANKLLASPGENSQAVMQLRFTNTQQIVEKEAEINDLIKQAIAVEEKGLKVDFKAKKELEYPDELTQKFASDAAYKAAFEALTPGRQRGYILHFTSAKQSATRASRIENCTDKILAGKGFNDR